MAPLGLAKPWRQRRAGHGLPQTSTRLPANLPPGTGARSGQRAAMEQPAGGRREPEREHGRYNSGE